MSKYIKKPVVVEAFKWTGDRDQEEDPLWIIEAIENGLAWIREGTSKYEPVMYITNSKDVMFAEKGDYIIKDAQGEIYSCKPDVFKKTYDKYPEYDEIVDLIKNQIHPNY